MNTLFIFTLDIPSGLMDSKPMPSNGQFNAANGATNQRKSTQSKPHVARTQAVKLQAALARAGEEIEKDIVRSKDMTTRARLAGSLASVAKGWQAMNEQLRVMRGVPLPGSLRPEKPSKKQQRVKASPTEAQEDGGDHKRVLGDDVKLNRSEQLERAAMPQDEPQPSDPAKTPPNPPKPQEGSNV